MRCRSLTVLNQQGRDFALVSEHKAQPMMHGILLNSDPSLLIEAAHVFTQ